MHTVQSRQGECSFPAVSLLIFQGKLRNMTILPGWRQQLYIPVNSAAILLVRINARMDEING